MAKLISLPEPQALALPWRTGKFRPLLYVRKRILPTGTSRCRVHYTPPMVAGSETLCTAASAAALV